MQLSNNIRLFICFMLFALSATAQKKSITIQGEIDSAVVSAYNISDVKASVYKTHVFEAELADQYLAPLDKDGAFRFSLPVEDSLVYISFWIITQGDKYKEHLPLNFPARTAVNLLKEVYLFEAGDDIQLDVKPQGVFEFSGKGSDKLKCQYQIKELDERSKGFNSRYLELLHAKEYEKAAAMDLAAGSRLIGLRLDILNSYKDNFNEDIYKLIKLDAIALSKFSRIFRLRNKINFRDIARTAPVSKSFFQSTCERDYPRDIDSSWYSRSAFYADMIFLQELNSFRLLKFPNVFYNEPIMDIREFLAFIDKRYQGPLREKLMLIAFYTLEHYQAESRHLAKAIMKTMENKTYRNLLQSWWDRQFAAFPFELNDFNGKVHKLSDFKGKLVVIDFWYTGCMWCTVLNGAMESIVEKYKNNKKIVFLNVNVDTDRKRWELGLKSGAYASPGSLSLNARWEGDTHPMIKYYGYTGYPNLLLIDGKGQIISSFPPRPAIDKPLGELGKDPVTGRVPPDPEATFRHPSTKKFLQLIDGNLK